MNHIETMKLALNQLDYVLDCINKDKTPFDGDSFHEAITALRQAIEQAEKQEPMPDDLILMYEKGWGDCETKLAEKQEPVAWMDVEYYKDEYEVSSNGEIRNKKTGKILSKNLMGSGYVKADLWKNGKRWQTSVHRIVATAFVDNPEKMTEVNHINGIKTDNRACNLEWVSRSDNVNHSYYELGNLVKPVIATNIETSEKRHYQSINAAERDGFHSAHILNVINGKRPHHKGFVFAYDTAPPKREWQGLTDEEVSAAVDDCDVYFDDEFLVEFARRIEAKLKEKNHD